MPHVLSLISSPGWTNHMRFIHHLRTETQMKWKSVAHMFSLFLSRQKENEPKASNAIWAVWLEKIAFQRPLSNRHTHTHTNTRTPGYNHRLNGKSPNNAQLAAKCARCASLFYF